MRFECDEAKRSGNLRKCGSDFVDVSEIFEGPMLTRLENRDDYVEER